MNIILTYQKLPGSIGALTHTNSDGSYTIVVNKNMCKDRQIHAVLHELAHIQGNDFARTEEEADMIEKMLHEDGRSLDLSEFQFFIA